MLPKRIIDQIVVILKKDCRRTLKMRVPGFPRPYYCGFLLRDTKWFNTWASSGSTYRRRSDHTRNVYCDLRVGNYSFDQVTDGGLYDNDDERESYHHVTVPIDEKDYDGLRIALWRLSESKFREALSDYSDRKAAGLSSPDSNKKFNSFVKVKPTRHIQYSRPEAVDEMRWVRFCKSASKWLSELKHVSGNFVEFDSTQLTKILVNTEGSVVVQHEKVFTLSACIRKLTKEGSQLEQELVINVGSQSELPNMRQFKRMLLHKYEQLIDLIKARKIHSFSGPVLLAPLPAGLLFHEALGHRLEGSRLLSTGEGQTFKGQVGKHITSEQITIYDNPRLAKFGGVKCIGSYHYDDEGVPADEALLVEKGILKGFLTTRAATKVSGHKSNGHARNRKHQRPISRMAVTVIEGEDGVSFKELKQLLIEEIKAQKKPYGMIVYETSGGETETTNYDFQAFAGEVTYATLLYPSGREECIRGVNLVGTPLQALDNIIAVGDTVEVDNSYCGAESGFLPITTISPAVLVKKLELQAKDEELVTPYILPRPRRVRNEH